MAGKCRDCSKCTERGAASSSKRFLNLVLICCTLGLSVVVSRIYGMFRKKCPTCKHPLAWHTTVNGMFKD